MSVGNKIVSSVPTREPDAGADATVHPPELESFRGARRLHPQRAGTYFVNTNQNLSHRPSEPQWKIVPSWRSPAPRLGAPQAVGPPFGRFRAPEPSRAAPCLARRRTFPGSVVRRLERLVLEEPDSGREILVLFHTPDHGLVSAGLHAKLEPSGRRLHRGARAHDLGTIQGDTRLGSWMTVMVISSWPPRRCTCRAWVMGAAPCSPARSRASHNGSGSTRATMGGWGISHGRAMTPVVWVPPSPIQRFSDECVRDRWVAGTS